MRAPPRRRLIAAAIAVLALAAVAAGLAVAATRDSNPRFTGPAIMNGYGPGMMMDGSGMMGGGSAPSGTQSSPGSLGDVRDWVERWLDSRGFEGFRVGEVMAFTNNDYVLVRDANGKPAFELLTGRGQAWLLEEPVGMMWNTRYGMMRGWTGGSAGSGMMGSMMSGDWDNWGDGNGWCGGYGAGRGSGKPVSAAEAVRIAERYLAQVRSGEQVEQTAQAFPGYLTLDTTRNGKVVGMLSVNASTGAAWYHGWHGGFLDEAEF